MKIYSLSTLKNCIIVLIIGIAILSCSTNSSNEINAKQPEQIVRDFYEALNKNDCKTARKSWPNYSKKECLKIRSIRINDIRPVPKNSNEVCLHILWQKDGEKEKSFRGYVALEKKDKHWIIGKSDSYKSLSSSKYKQRCFDESILQNQTNDDISPQKEVIKEAQIPTVPTDIEDSFNPCYQQNGKAIIINISEQTLYLCNEGRKVESYPVSTAKNGIGSESGSGKTPLGLHQIAQKIGDGAEKLTIFKARRNTGKKAVLNAKNAGDLVTTRIMWLEGLEQNKNQGVGVDSYQRYIYIHGTAEEKLIGQPASHGCIRMYNDDVIELFNQVDEGTKVDILDEIL